MTKKKRVVKAKIFHVGKRVPKGFEELAGGIHLGKGIWMLPMRPITLTPKRKAK